MRSYLHNNIEQQKFETLILMLAEMSYHGDYSEEISFFEDKITEACKKKGLEAPYFGIARHNWDRIEFTPRYSKIKFYAEYYDGMQAPFRVCEWDDDIEKLEELLKNTSDELYHLYQKKLEINFNL